VKLVYTLVNVWSVPEKYEPMNSGLALKIILIGNVVFAESAAWPNKSNSSSIVVIPKLVEPLVNWLVVI